MFKLKELEIENEVLRGQVYLLGELSKILVEEMEERQKSMKRKIPSYEDQIASLDWQMRFLKK